MDQRNCIKLCVENEVKCARTFDILTVTFGESTMSITQVQLWYNRIKEDVLVARARRQPTKTLSREENDNVESLLERLLMMLAYRSAYAKQLDIAMLDDVQRRSRFAPKRS